MPFANESTMLHCTGLKHAGELSFGQLSYPAGTGRSGAEAVPDVHPIIFLNSFGVMPVVFLNRSENAPAFS